MDNRRESQSFRKDLIHTRTVLDALLKLFLNEDIVLSAIHEPHSLVVSRSLAIRGVDVVAFSLCTILVTDSHKSIKINLRFHAIICLGPGTHLVGLSRQ